MALTLAKARSEWMRRHGLVSPQATSCAEALELGGWVHAIGGLDAYVSLRARSPRLDRASIDRAVTRGDVHIVTACRGCTMLVPDADRDVALAVGRMIGEPRMLRELSKAGVEESEMESARQTILAALSGGPLSPRAIRDASPKGAYRSLGEVGKKLGMSSVLSPALRSLEWAGRVRRIPDGDRLDSGRFSWALCEGSPVPSAAAPAILAERYLRHAAPATVREFATWSGLGVREARNAIETVHIERTTIDGFEGECFRRPGGASAGAPPTSVVFVGLRDPYVDHRGNLERLIAAEDAAVRVDGWGSGPVRLGEARSLHNRPFLVRGRIGGLWEFDEDNGDVVWGAFTAPSKSVHSSIDRAARKLEAFVREQIGHARIYPMDGKAKRRRRLDVVRHLAR